MELFKIYVIDNGDWSVGIPPMHFEIVCPFMSDEDDDIKEQFRKDVIELYKPYCEGRIDAIYDGEMD
jgi:hypothetical protein